MFVCVCPTHPCAHIIPAVLKKNYKTAGMAPVINTKKYNLTQLLTPHNKH